MIKQYGDYFQETQYLALSSMLIYGFDSYPNRESLKYTFFSIYVSVFPKV